MHLLADIVLPGHHFGQVTEPAAGSDAFVLLTLGFLGFLFGAFAVAAVVLWRRENHPSPDKRLLMELDEASDKPEAAPSSGGKDESEGQPWERQADWWKKP